MAVNPKYVCTRDVKLLRGLILDLIAQLLARESKIEMRLLLDNIERIPSHHYRQSLTIYPFALRPFLILTQGHSFVLKYNAILAVTRSGESKFRIYVS